MNKPTSFWPYGIILFFVVAVTYLVGFVVMATRNSTELVRPDYYEHEVEHQLQIDRETRTVALPEQPEVLLDPDNRKLRLVFPVALKSRVKEASATFYRPSDQSLDRRVPLVPGAAPPEGISLDLSGFAAGFWKLQLAWTMDDEEYFLECPLFLP